MKKQTIISAISAISAFVYLTLLSCQAGTSPTAGEVKETTPEKKNFIVYTAPENEVLNTRYRVTVNGENSPVYDVKVASASKDLRQKARQDIPASGNYFETAGMTYFDLHSGSVEVTVTVDEAIKEAYILPEDAGITPQLNGKSLTFTVDHPQNLTVVINGDKVRCLHLFVNGEETDIPDAKDPNVVYFGPGSYRLPAAEIEDGMTVYVAGGSVVRCYVGPHEWYTINPVTKQKNYDKFYMYDLNGKNITFKGRGIVCLNDIPTHSRRAVRVHGENIRMRGVIFRGPSEWAIDVQDSKDVVIDNIKIIGYRAQTDGVDIASSQNVRVENCFIRTFGYPVREQQEKVSTNVTIRNSILWNDGGNELPEAIEANNSIYNIFNQ